MVRLDRIAPLVPCIKQNGGIWVVTPKGRKDLRDLEVMAAGKAALKFVIPRAERKK